MFHNVMCASGRAVLPAELNCFSELAHTHRLPDSRLFYEDHKFHTNMQMLRNRDGLGPPLKRGMERFAARQTGRLPFLRSSNLMEHVLTGRLEDISFEDVLSQPQHDEHLHQPHIIVERAMGISL
nr:proteasome maturation protein [Drosophila virilis]